MLTSKNLPNLNSAFAVITGSESIAAYPNLTEMYKYAKQFQKQKSSTLFKEAGSLNGMPQYKLSDCAQTLHNRLPYVMNAAWFHMPLRKHPLIECFLQMANMHGLLIPSYNFMNAAHHMLGHFQHAVATREFNRDLDAWNTSFQTSSRSLDSAFKMVFKESSGVELQEIVLYTNFATVNGSLQQFQENAMNCFLDMFNPVQHEQVLAIVTKTEFTRYNQLKIRFILLLKQEFIDDQSHALDSSCFSHFKDFVERNNSYFLLHENGFLNGFLYDNRICKNHSDFKEQLQRLKTYLVDTDVLFRVVDTNPTCKVLYIKDPKKNQEGI